MKVTPFTRRALAARRLQRSVSLQAEQLRAMGWHYVGEDGGPLWEIHRGHRSIDGERIVGVMIAQDGMGVWVRFGKIWA